MRKQRTRDAVWSWEIIAAFCCFAGGLGSVLIGSVLTASTWILGAETHPWVRGLGTAFLILTVPLLILAGYCMDWAEQEPKESQHPTSENRERGSTPIYQVLLTAIILTLSVMAPIELQAQQTVFNVPTTDVLDPGKVYVELDISAKPNEPKFSSFVPRVVIGVGGDVEVGLNVLGNIQPGADSTTLSPAVKWRVYKNEENGWSIVLGNNFFIPVRNKSYNFGTYSYLMTQKSFKTGTRIGFGGNFFSENVVAPNASRAGGQFTIEQAINKRFGVQADWFTGKHAFGYFTPGGYFKITPRLTGYAAYSIGNANATNGNHYFYFELGYNIN